MGVMAPDLGVRDTLLDARRYFLVLELGFQLLIQITPHSSSPCRGSPRDEAVLRRGLKGGKIRV